MLSATMSERIELARRILDAIAQGLPVPSEDAIRLRNWANNPTEALANIEDVARSILNRRAGEAE